VLDASTTVDPDGDGISFAWQLDGRPAGTAPSTRARAPRVNEVHLDATDNPALGRSGGEDHHGAGYNCAGLRAAGDADLTSCDPQVDVLPLTPPGVTDACTGWPILEAFLVMEMA